MKSKLEYICGRNYNGLSESTHIKYIQRCFELARKGSGAVHPNPMVGCVIVHKGQIIGEGYHSAYGKPHAEVEAIANVKDKSLLTQSTLYVNLEPCAHFGKTPPCADLIIKHKIPNVVICNIDPHAKVAGKGIEKMRATGINVTSGVLVNSGLELNKSFFTFHQKQRPYIVLKWAETQDGFMGRLSGDVEPKQISNALSNRFVHKLRSESGAILVGTNTAIQDNPSLTTRLVDGRNPLRVIIDTTGRIPETHNIFSDGNNNLIIGKQRDLANSEFINLSKDDNWQAILNALYERDIIQVLVEGGSNTLEQLLNLGLWDEIYVIKSEIIWSEGVKSPKLNLPSNRQFKLGNDIVTYYTNR